MKACKRIFLLAFCALQVGCASILSGNQDRVIFYGANVPLVFRDIYADTIIPSQYEVGALDVVNTISLDKRADFYFLELDNGMEADSVILMPSLSYYWMIPNMINYELGFLIDCHTKSNYYYANQQVKLAPPPRSLSIPRPEYDSVMGVFTLGLGMAFPMFYPAQGPSSASASFGAKVWKGFVIGADVSAAGTSDGVVGKDVVNMNSSMFGMHVSYYPSEGFFLTLQPTFHHISYYKSGVLDDPDIFRGSRNHIKLGFGAGVRSGGVMMDLRLFPSAATEILTNGRRVHSGLVQIRLGYSGDVLLSR